MKLNQLRPGDLLTYTFTRSAIESGDYQPFLDLFGLEQLPQGRALRPLFDRLIFFTAGYDADERELYEIPEVRRFFQSLHRAWPFWFFAGNLAAPNLLTMTFCCLPDLQVVRRPGRLMPEVRLDGEQFGGFLAEQFDGMNQLFERAGMSEVQNRERTRQIQAYYQRDWSALARAFAPLS